MPGQGPAWNRPGTPLVEVLTIGMPNAEILDTDDPMDFGYVLEYEVDGESFFELPRPDLRQSVWIVDWDNDGLQDVVALGGVRDASDTVTAAAVLIARQADPMDQMMNNGQPQSFDAFTAMQWPPAATNVLGCKPENIGPPLQLADFDNDGDIDVVTQHAILMNQGFVDPLNPDLDEIQWSAPECHPGYAWGGVALSDYDGNGAIDFVASRVDVDLDEFTNFTGRPLPLTGIELLRNNAGVFSKTQIGTTRPVGLLSSGDYDGDFVDDLVYHRDRHAVR